MSKINKILSTGLVGSAVFVMAGCATTSGSTNSRVAQSKAIASKVAVHLDHLSNRQVVDCLDVNTLMGAALLSNKADLGVPRDIMLEITALNLDVWIDARNRRITDGVTKKDVMDSGEFRAKLDNLERADKSTFLKKENVKCDAYLEGARDANLAEIRKAKSATDLEG